MNEDRKVAGILAKDIKNRPAFRDAVNTYTANVQDLYIVIRKL